MSAGKAGGESTSRARRIRSWADGRLAGLVDEPGAAAEGALVQALELAADVAPGVCGLVLGDPDQQQRQPAQLDVGADAVFLAVMHRAEVERGLHVAPGALDLEQLLVAERDVLGAQRRVAAAQQELAVEVRLGADGGAVDPEQAATGLAQEPLEAALGLHAAGELGALGRAELV